MWIFFFARLLRTARTAHEDANQQFLICNKVLRKPLTFIGFVWHAVGFRFTHSDTVSPCWKVALSELSQFLGVQSHPAERLCQNMLKDRMWLRSAASAKFPHRQNIHWLLLLGCVCVEWDLKVLAVEFRTNSYSIISGTLADSILTYVRTTAGILTQE